KNHLMHSRPIINALSPHCRYLEKARGSTLTTSLPAKGPFLGLPLPPTTPVSLPFELQNLGSRRSGAFTVDESGAGDSVSGGL
ncbi:hypothetical protein U1Q18_038081, partial [Sarracenia purpurea var. burkii]